MENGREFIGLVRASFLRGSVGTLDLDEPLTVTASSTVADAVALLQQHNVGCVLVTSADGKLLGVFTERDVLRRYVGSPRDPATTPITELMTASPHTITMTTSMAFALNMMAEGGYRHLPVVAEDGTPLAVLSIRDLVRHIAGTVTAEL